MSSTPHVTIENKTLSAADFTNSHTVSVDATSVSLFARNGDLQIALTSAGSTYRTIPHQTAFEIRGRFFNGHDIFIKPASAGDVVEIVTMLGP